MKSSRKNHSEPFVTKIVEIFHNEAYRALLYIPIFLFFNLGVKLQLTLIYLKFMRKVLSTIFLHKIHFFELPKDKSISNC